MRTYIRRLKNSGLNGGCISKSAFKGVVPQKIFLCIWPSDPNILRRANFLVDSKNEFILTAKSCPQEKKYILKFDKTANVFDEKGFFWTAAKGHYFQIETEDIKQNRIIFCVDRTNKNRYFSDMLQVVSQKNPTSLTKYLLQNFDVKDKNTYAFAIYMQIDFSEDIITLGDSSEKVYRFRSPISFLGDIHINAVLYEYSKEYQSKMNATAVDPKIMEQAYVPQVTNENETQESVHSVLKNCISDFLKSHDPKKINDDDYTILVEDILENLSKIHHEN